MHFAKADVIRQGVLEFVERWEQKEAFRLAEKKRREQEEVDSRRARLSRGTKSPGSKLAPLPGLDERTTVVGGTPSSAQLSRFEAFYEEQAKSILEADGDDYEFTRRARLALVAVKREFPLSHPDDDVVAEGVERALQRLRRARAGASVQTSPPPSAPPASPPAPSVPLGPAPKTAREIDVSSLPTRVVKK